MSERFITILRGYIDCSDRSLGAKIFRVLALGISIPYSLITRLRNILYDAGICRSNRAPVTTIGVGNLTLGGVGKTPLVAWLIQHCLENSHFPGVISRGYKANQQEDLFKRLVSTLDQDFLVHNSFSHGLNDEACELAILFPNIPHLLNANRVEASKELIRNNPNVSILILDDAFQHRRIKRDLNILVIDALNPFGGKRVVPAGFLREPLCGMKRANVIVLNRSDLIMPDERTAIRSYAKKYAPSACWAEIAQQPCTVFYYERKKNDQLTIRRQEYAKWKNSFHNKHFLAFCGLGAPAGFKKTLDQEGLIVSDFISFSDHCVYGSKEYELLTNKIKSSHADAFLVTMKDFVKLSEFAQISEKPIYALGIGIVFISGQSEFNKVFQKAFR